MARIETYRTDENVTGNDSWIGSDGDSNNKTKNFTPINLAKFYNNGEIIDSVNTFKHKFTVLKTGESIQSGNIYIPNNTIKEKDFSTISTLIMSKSSIGGKDIEDFIRALKNSKITLSRSNTPNQFGVYTLLNVIDYPQNNDFLYLTVSFIAGNGSIVDDLNMSTTLISYSSDIQGIEQNNIVTEQVFVFVDDMGLGRKQDYELYISNFLTTYSTTVAEDEIKFLKFMMVHNIPKPDITSEKSNILKYMFKPGKGTFANNITLNDLLFISSEKVSFYDIEDDDSVIAYDLGVVPPLESFTKVINESATPYDFSDQSKLYFVKYNQDGNDFLAQFIGTPGIYGDTLLQCTEADFKIIQDATIGGGNSKQNKPVKNIDSSLEIDPYEIVNEDKNFTLVTQSDDLKVSNIILQDNQLEVDDEVEILLMDSIDKIHRIYPDINAIIYYKGNEIVYGENIAIKDSSKVYIKCIAENYYVLNIVTLSGSVIKVNTFYDLPIQGDTEALYITVGNGKLYQYNGSSYIIVSDGYATPDDLALARTSAPEKTVPVGDDELSAQDSENLFGLIKIKLSTIKDFVVDSLGGLFVRADAVDQDIDGTKTFLNPPTTPYPSDPYHIAPKIYVDNEVQVISDLLVGKEDLVNKQSNLAQDGSNNKYPTVDAVNNAFVEMGKSLLQNGLTSTSDGFALEVFDASTLRIKAIDQCFFQYKLLTSLFTFEESLRSFPQQDISLNTLGLPDGTHVRFVGIDYDGIITFSPTTFVTSSTHINLGYIFVKVTGGVHSFLDGADPSGRNLVNTPSIAGYSSLEVALARITCSVVIKPNANLTVNNTQGILTGLSVNWKQPLTNIRNIALSNTSSFSQVSPANQLATPVPPQTTTVDPTMYYDGANLVAVPAANNATVMRWLYGIGGKLVLQYGEAFYSDLATAKTNVFIAPFTSLLPTGAYVEVSRMCIAKSTTALNDTAKVSFHPVGSVSSGGGGSGNLVDSVNGKVGVVVITPDDLVDTSTTNKFTNTTEKNTWNGKQDVSNQITVSASGNVDDSWHGKTVFFSGSLALTIPNTLRSNFIFNGITKPGCTITWTITAPFTWGFDPTPLTSEKHTFTMVRELTTNNIYILY